jgi:hypothetical protein
LGGEFHESFRHRNGIHLGSRSVDSDRSSYLDNCPLCEQHVCDKLRERLVVYEQVRLRFGAEIPEKDRLCFIRPYENSNSSMP